MKSRGIRAATASIAAVARGWRAALALAGLVACSMASAAGMHEAVLDAGWEFRLARGNVRASHPAAATQWHAATVPGTVHTDLLAHGLIPDPYVGAPEAGLQWIGLADWEYRLAFDAPPEALAASRSDLVFDGLDTFAEVFLNDEKVLDADNFFRTWRIPVRDRLRPGRNELRVLLHSPISRLLPTVLAMPHRIAGNYPSPYGDEPPDAMTGNFVRKPGYHYGWDWGPRYVTSGIWQPVRLQSWDAARIADLFLRQEGIDARRADLTALVDIDVALAGRYTLRLTQTAPDDVVSTVDVRETTLAEGKHVIAVPIRVESPRRWYPVGYGEQALYRYEVELVQDGATVARRATRTGLRSVELRREPDATGSGFEFVVNGVPVFAKGANAIPFDMFLPRVDDARLRHVLRSAVDANMNMLRVWGGGAYQTDAFYALADELGLLVWQDFMFGGGMQPAYDPGFRANVVAEARQQVRRLRNHPSLVLWCGNNEEEIAGKYWGHGESLRKADPAFAETVWDGYVQLFGHELRAVVAEDAGGVAYWSSSPSNDLAEVANTPAAGNMHYWEVWGNPARPPEAYLDVTPRFMAEFGMQAWPVQPTVDSFASRGEQAIDAPVIEAHQKFLAGKGNERLLHYIRMAYGEPRDFADFIYLSQATQADAIALAALHHRASRPRTMGSLYWQLNDVWPGASWSGIDWYGRWKALHYHARRFFAPVTVAALRKDGATRVTLVSDRTEPRAGRLHLRVLALDGRLLREEWQAVTLPPLSATQLATHADENLLSGADPATTVAVFDLLVDGEPPARGIVYFRPAKDIAWIDPAITASLRESDGDRVLELSSAALAHAVWTDFGSIDAELSDNAMTLLPGESARVHVRSSASLADLRAALRIRAFPGPVLPVSEPPRGP